MSCEIVCVELGKSLGVVIIGLQEPTQLIRVPCNEQSFPCLCAVALGLGKTVKDQSKGAVLSVWGGHVPNTCTE